MLFGPHRKSFVGIIKKIYYWVDYMPLYYEYIICDRGFTSVRTISTRNKGMVVGGGLEAGTGREPCKMEE
jgi:hypothetical protein